tara:strand:- start:14 stop:610 length:597 start_codon:yes stop_codon:yes gene_type:complete
MANYIKAFVDKIEDFNDLEIEFRLGTFNSYFINGINPDIFNKLKNNIESLNLPMTNKKSMDIILHNNDKIILNDNYITIVNKVRVNIKDIQIFNNYFIRLSAAKETIKQSQYISESRKSVLINYYKHDPATKTTRYKSRDTFVDTSNNIQYDFTSVICNGNTTLEIEVEFIGENTLPRDIIFKSLVSGYNNIIKYLHH